MDGVCVLSEQNMADFFYSLGIVQRFSDTCLAINIYSSLRLITCIVRMICYFMRTMWKASADSCVYTVRHSAVISTDIYE